MIKKYKQHLKESRSNIDPYNEEEWDDEFKVGDKIGYVKIRLNGVIKSKKVKNGWVDDPDDDPITIYKIEWNKNEVPNDFASKEWRNWIETEYSQEQLSSLIKKNLFKKV